MKTADPKTSFLDRVEADLARVFADETGGELIADAGRQLVLAPDAKRMRPLFVRETGTAWGLPDDAMLDLALSAELVHSASLLHDDVVDAGSFRRGRPTANARFGNATAVLAGDWLLTVALARLHTLPRPVSHEALHVVARMSQAAVLEVLSRGRLDGGVTTWRHVAEGKTGTLFGWCGWAPAFVADDPAGADALRRFGLHLGVAFQLADDLNDTTGDEAGKDRFSDIRERTPSYPLLVAASRAPAFARRLEHAWSLDIRSPELVRTLGLEALDAGAADATLAALHAELDAAASCLDPVGPRAAPLQALADTFRVRLKRRAA